MMPPVIILAGGLGTRLLDVTHDQLPKPMVPVLYQGKNYPFLLFLLSNLSKQGIRKVILCVDHMAEKIVSYLGDGHQYEMEITYDYAGTVLTAARVKHVIQNLKESEFIIHVGDVFHPLNFDKFYENFRKRPHNLLQIAVHSPSKNENVASNVLVDKNFQVVGYNEKTPGKNRPVIDTGVLLARREIVSYISDSPRASLTDDLYPTLINLGVVGAYESGVAFFDIGTPREYGRFCRYVEQAQISPLLNSD